MRHRNMYYATGLPGWMRFGYSPGWAGRGGRGPGRRTQYIMTGQWPTPQLAAAEGPGFAPHSAAQVGTASAPVTLAALRAQAQLLTEQLVALSDRIEELERRAE